jgi:hypothetical protein
MVGKGPKDRSDAKRAGTSTRRGSADDDTEAAKLPLPPRVDRGGDLRGRTVRFEGDEPDGTITSLSGVVVAHGQGGSEVGISVEGHQDLRWIPLALIEVDTDTETLGLGEQAALETAREIGCDGEGTRDDLIALKDALEERMIGAIDEAAGYRAALEAIAADLPSESLQGPALNFVETVVASIKWAGLRRPEGCREGKP